MSELPMAKQNCGNCRFWDASNKHESDSSDVEYISICRRFPPVYTGGDYDTWENGAWNFPRPESWQWCGEWKPCEDAPQNDLNAKSIRELGLSTRAFGGLTSEDMFGGKLSTVAELCNKTAEELLEIRNFGQTSIREVRQELKKLGLKLRLD